MAEVQVPVGPHADCRSDRVTPTKLTLPDSLFIAKWSLYVSLAAAMIAIPPFPLNTDPSEFLPTVADIFWDAMMGLLYIFIGHIRRVHKVGRVLKWGGYARLVDVLASYIMVTSTNGLYWLSAMLLSFSFLLMMVAVVLAVLDDMQGGGGLRKRMKLPKLPKIRWRAPKPVFPPVPAPRPTTT